MGWNVARLVRIGLMMLAGGVVLAAGAATAAPYRLTFSGPVQGSFDVETAGSTDTFVYGPMLGFGPSLGQTVSASNGTGAFVGLSPSVSLIDPVQFNAYQNAYTSRFGSPFAFLPFSLTVGSPSLGDSGFTGPKLFDYDSNGTTLRTGSFSGLIGYLDYSISGRAAHFVRTGITVRVSALSGPGAPGPELGGGWLAGLAGLGALAMVRWRRRAAGLAA